MNANSLYTVPFFKLQIVALRLKSSVAGIGTGTVFDLPIVSFLLLFVQQLRFFLIKWLRLESLFHNAADSVKKGDVTERKGSNLKGEARRLHVTVAELYGNRCTRGGFSECNAP